MPGVLVVAPAVVRMTAVLRCIGIGVAGVALVARSVGRGVVVLVIVVGLHGVPLRT